MTSVLKFIRFSQFAYNSYTQSWPITVWQALQDKFHGKPAGCLQYSNSFMQLHKHTQYPRTLTAVLAGLLTRHNVTDDFIVVCGTRSSELTRQIYFYPMDSYGPQVKRFFFSAQLLKGYDLNGNPTINCLTNGDVKKWSDMVYICFLYCVISVGELQLMRR